jgi:hypothetical protein
MVGKRHFDSGTESTPTLNPSPSLGEGLKNSTARVKPMAARILGRMLAMLSSSLAKPGPQDVMFLVPLTDGIDWNVYILGFWPLQ